MSHVNTVESIYEAFGRGDVPAILERLSESVEWEYTGSYDEVPWLRARRGRAGAAEFFASLGELEFEKFVPTGLFESGNTVVALVDVEFKVKATGKPIREQDEVHIWHFDGHGRVARFRHRVDTHQHLAAHRGA